MRRLLLTSKAGEVVELLALVCHTTLLLGGELHVPWGPSAQKRIDSSNRAREALARQVKPSATNFNRVLAA